jgi:hypothetical protein
MPFARAKIDWLELQRADVIVPVSLRLDPALRAHDWLPKNYTRDLHSTVRESRPVMPVAPA